MWDKLFISDGRVKFALFYSIVIAGLTAAFLLSPVEERRSLCQPAYLTVCLLMGAALGLDVMCATIGRFRELSTWSKRFMWSYRAAAGHTIFPLAGVLACFTCASFFGAIERVVGLAGFLLIAFIYGMEVREILTCAHDDNQQQSLQNTSGPAVEGKEWALVLAVSLDSLLSGPAQSAQQTAWTLLQSLGSFILVGLIVGILGVAAAIISCRLLALTDQAGAQSAGILAKMQMTGLFFELSVIGYFGWHALLVFGLGLELPCAGAALCSLGTSVLFFALLGKQLWAAHLGEAKKAVAK